MKLSKEETQNIQRLADQLSEALSEAGCDAVVLAATFGSTCDSTCWLFRTKGNTFACRDLARLYVEDTTRFFVDAASNQNGE